MSAGGEFSHVNGANVWAITLVTIRSIIITTAEQCAKVMGPAGRYMYPSSGFVAGPLWESEETGGRVGSKRTSDGITLSRCEYY